MGYSVGSNGSACVGSLMDPEVWRLRFRVWYIGSRVLGIGSYLQQCPEVLRSACGTEVVPAWLQGHALVQRPEADLAHQVIRCGQLERCVHVGLHASQSALTVCHPAGTGAGSLSKERM